MRKAMQQLGEADDRPSAQAQSQNTPPSRHFRGSGKKLGDGTEDPESPTQDPEPAEAALPRVNRQITFWKQGFQVDDGPLYLYDDEANANSLRELNRGRVPMSILNVGFSQDVDVKVIRRVDEEWTPARQSFGGFHGGGQRLGSPVPGESIAGDTSIPASAEPVSETAQPPSEEGDCAVQIRFANGKRTLHKFFSSDTVSSVYEFVRQHPFHESGRGFVLSHAFPVKAIEEDGGVTVAEAQLKNAVVVQRWT